MAILGSVDPSIIQSVGIPRSLLFYRYGVLWTEFFEALGYEVVVSEPTDKAIVEEGDKRLVDESCLASKVFIGCVETLLNRCDSLFIPSFGNSDHKAGFCTKFQAQQDLVANVFGSQAPPILTLRVEKITDKKLARKAFEGLAQELGASPRDAHRAWKRAMAAQEASDKAKASAQEKTLKLLQEYREVVAKDPKGNEQAPLAILLLAHPYIGHDPYISGAILDALKAMDVVVLFADETNHERTFKKSMEFSATMPWIINRELIGSMLMLKDKVDGIVMVSAFPCGPDSMTNDALMREVTGIPLLNLMIDAQSGTAGVETRVESFVDIIRFQKEGGYISHGA